MPSGPKPCQLSCVGTMQLTVCWRIRQCWKLGLSDIGHTLQGGPDLLHHCVLVCCESENGLTSHDKKVWKEVCFTSAKPMLAKLCVLGPATLRHCSTVRPLKVCAGVLQNTTSNARFLRRG